MYPLNKFIVFLLRPFWFVFDLIFPKKSHYWAFCTHHLHADRFIENQRAVFEYVKKDKSIKKIIFYRGEKIDFLIEDAENFEIVEHGSFRGLWLLSQCKVIYLTHSIAMEFSIRYGVKKFYIFPISMWNRVVVNLWHAISVKKLYSVANKETRLHTDRVGYRNRERLRYSGVIASSDVDSYAMAAMFHPVNYQQVWCTGLPRNDFLHLSDLCLPKYISQCLDDIKRLTKGRRLVVYAPTYRQTSACDSAYYYQFCEDEINNLKNILRENNAVLGYRSHYFKNNDKYFNMSDFIDGETILDFSFQKIPEFSAVARACDLLITDYSSVYLETLYLGKDAICFAYDWDSYKLHQDGLLYDLEMIFPGEVITQFDSVVKEVGDKLKGLKGRSENKKEWVRKMFFNYCDGKNSERVYKKVIEALKE